MVESAIMLLVFLPVWFMAFSFLQSGLAILNAYGGGRQQEFARIQEADAGPALCNAAGMMTVAPPTPIGGYGLAGGGIFLPPGGGGRTYQVISQAWNGGAVPGVFGGAVMPVFRSFVLPCGQGVPAAPQVPHLNAATKRAAMTPPTPAVTANQLHFDLLP